MITNHENPSAFNATLPDGLAWDTFLDECSRETTERFLQSPEDSAWKQLLPYLPSDLEKSARHYGAFLRSNQISSAALLLRLILAYASGPSLDTIAARAVELHLVEHLSDNALHERFERLVPWMSYLIGQQLAGNQQTFPWGVALRIRLLDATVLCRPGATGTDWRLHLGMNLQTGLIDHLSVTGANIGECLADFPLEPGDLVIGDRGYATRHGLAAVQAKNAYSLIRLNWKNVPLLDHDGQPIDLQALLHTVATGTRQEWRVQTAPTADILAIPGRLILIALTEEAAATARRKVRRAAQKNGQTPTALSLAAAGYVILFTTVPKELLTTEQVTALYRMRWQIEIAFKRDKSALGLDKIRAKTDAVCYAVILAKCLLLLLVERIAWATGIFSPSGDLTETHEPLSLFQGVVGDREDDLAPATEPAELVDVATRCALSLLYRPTTSPTSFTA